MPTTTPTAFISRPGEVWLCFRLGFLALVTRAEEVQAAVRRLVRKKLTQEFLKADGTYWSLAALSGGFR
jgi:hypothetical protein